MVTAEYPTKLTLFAPAYMQNPCDPSGKTVFARFAWVVPQKNAFPVPVWGSVAQNATALTGSGAGDNPDPVHPVVAPKTQINSVIPIKQPSFDTVIPSLLKISSDPSSATNRRVTRERWSMTTGA